MASSQHPLAPLTASAAPLAGHSAEVRSGDDVEKAAGAHRRALDRFRRTRSRVHDLWTRNKKWIGTVLAILLVLGVIGGIVGGILADYHPWASTEAWQRDHDYDSPIHSMFSSNWPDPAWMFYEGDLYIYGTNNAAGILSRPPNASDIGFGEANIQLGVSVDDRPMAFADALRQPLPDVGGWAASGMTHATINSPAVPQANGWSPGIIQRKSDKRFILYYAAAIASQGSNARKDVHCVGAAVSPPKSPQGPFEPLDEPLVCDVERGGVIDPSPFRDKDGTMWLTYKIDGNHIGHGGRCNNMKEPIVPTPIMLQRMRKDGITPDGLPIQLLDRTPEDGPLVEAPDIVRSKEGVYFLFHSSGCTTDSSYDIKYATAEAIAGPYIRAPKKLLTTGEWGLDAPGSPSVIKHPKENTWLMAFASRKKTAQGGVRTVSWTRLSLEGRYARVINEAERSRLLVHRSH